jgi:shikimate dehydrogenase
VNRYVVAGNPVEHSQSPFIHAEFARQTGEAIVYERLLCPLDGFAATLAAFALAGGSGCNVTMPFKFAAFELAKEVTPRAARAGACNTLRFDADGWHGDNTDGAGLVRDIEHNAGVALDGTRVLVIGAGGGAAGVLGPLIAAGAGEVVVANRTVARAESLVARHVRQAARERRCARVRSTRVAPAST